MLTRVLDMERRKVGHIMTPLNKVMSVALNSPVDSRLLKRIASSSFSRLPVHEVGDTHAFRGMLLVTTLLKSKASAQLLVSDLEILPLPEIHPSVTCLQTLNYFRAGRSHLLLVSRSPGHGNGALGIVTMDDVLQELIHDKQSDDVNVCMTDGDDDSREPTFEVPSIARVRAD